MVRFRVLKFSVFLFDLFLEEGKHFFFPKVFSWLDPSTVPCQLLIYLHFLLSYSAIQEFWAGAITSLMPKTQTAGGTVTMTAAVR